MLDLKAKRIALLEQQIEEDPTDPFPRYALAMELMERGAGEALVHLRYLLENRPDYLPSYYQAALLFAELQDFENASKTFQAGIALAQAQQAAKALHELQSAYQNYLYENDLET